MLKYGVVPVKESEYVLIENMHETKYSVNCIVIHL
jgi:hypothetical protein